MLVIRPAVVDALDDTGAGRANSGHPIFPVDGLAEVGPKSGGQRFIPTPEEAKPPVELARMEQPFLAPPHPFFHAREYVGDYGLLQAILDPYINAIHVSLLRQRKESSQRTHGYLTLLSDRLLLDGPFTLSPGEKNAPVGCRCHAGNAPEIMEQSLFPSA